MKHTFLLIFATFQFAVAQPKEPVTALLGAFAEEIKLVEQSLIEPQVQMLHGQRFVTGRIGKQRVVVAETGIGKVNAAATTAFVLAHFQPVRVIFTGIAGGVSPDLNPGDLVIAARTTYHDYKSVTFDGKPTRQTYRSTTRALNPPFFLADSALLAQAVAVGKTITLDVPPGETRPPALVVGTVVTGDEFVNSAERVAALRSEFGADATEMEGAAVAQVCHQQGLPCLVIRSLSDKADSDARRDMLTFYKTAARNSANVVLALVRALR